MQLAIVELGHRVVRVRREHTIELTPGQREAPGARVERGVLPHHRTHPARELLPASRGGRTVAADDASLVAE